MKPHATLRSLLTEPCQSYMRPFRVMGAQPDVFVYGYHSEHAARQVYPQVECPRAVDIPVDEIINTMLDTNPPAVVTMPAEFARGFPVHPA